ncbi:histidine phosphatase family protein [Synechococcus sp. CS-1325]|uniref:histidine phosphatase family protein n=1 Tax=unclassified Synechococcus TaxID=2626047 RepID=UPI000DB1E3F1|nr:MULTISPECIES: histidine phosphatase family protein [unclassified Synechococcus]MCT0199088.1 histidine phosphatase family protein [Synechococcus sp. CS-1325]MCT0212554.1 histidine phosphatase family protein [Synechococcus sp. CS-1326]MCT0232070.1 histidine phosphatase family protein [Synechococcus sp. CS-1327]PZU99515.1 MAG: histidine phosphatase family protein [Cyanobium sp.]
MTSSNPAPELWLLRHGATAWARDGRHTGNTDLALLPEGEAEARALAPLLAELRFAAVLCSPLQRARQTCELAGLAQSASLCEELREWDYGAYEGLTTPEIRQEVPGWTVWTHGCEGGESIEQVEHRCQQVIEQALALAENGRVALFAHGHILRALGGSWLGLGARGGGLLALNTGTVSVLGHERDRRVVLRWNAPTSGPAA